MFERFTAKARHTVVLSQEEARKLQHNYIGTEHILLGLLGEPEGIAGQVLASFGITRDEVRTSVIDMVGAGSEEPKGHIPFTPRAKKVLELSLREALSLHHNYIGTEHILLGLLREGDGVAAQIMRKHADLLAIRAAVLDAVPAGTAAEGGGAKRRWLRRLITGEAGTPDAPGGEAAEQTLSATPAADTTLSEAARIAGSQPVGSHHLLLATLADSNSAAARVLSSMGLDLDQAKEALRGADVTGTSDEQPEDAGRRQMTIQVSEETVTVLVADPVIAQAGKAALTAVGGKGGTPGDVLRGADFTGSAADSLARAWQALNDALTVIKNTAEPASGDKPAGGEESEKAGDGEAG